MWPSGRKPSHNVECGDCGEVFALSSRKITWNMHCDSCAGLERGRIEARLSTVNEIDIRRHQYILISRDAKPGDRIPLFDEDGNFNFTAKPVKLFDYRGMKIFGIKPDDFMLDEDGEKIFLIDKEGKIRIVDDSGSAPENIGKIHDMHLLAISRKHYVEDEKYILLNENGEPNFFSEPVVEGEREKDKNLVGKIIDFVFGDGKDEGDTKEEESNEKDDEEESNEKDDEEESNEKDKEKEDGFFKL